MDFLTNATIDVIVWTIIVVAFIGALVSVAVISLP